MCMEASEAVEFVSTDPNAEVEEKEFNVGFSKSDEMAYIHTSIRSQIKRCLSHSDIEAERLSVYNEDSDTYRKITLEDFDGNGQIVSFVGKLPIESLKIQSNPRSQRSYANIISSQTQVNIN